jgi:hypothetical protein
MDYEVKRGSFKVAWSFAAVLSVVDPAPSQDPKAVKGRWTWLWRGVGTYRGHTGPSSVMPIVRCELAFSRPFHIASAFSSCGFCGVGIMARRYLLKLL